MQLTFSAWTGTSPARPWLCRSRPVTRNTPPTASSATPGQTLTSRLWNTLSACREANTSESHGANLGCPQARSTCVSSTSAVAGSSAGRPRLAALFVKWLRMSTRARQSDISPVLVRSATNTPLAQSAGSRAAMPLSSSPIVIVNSAGSAVNPAGTDAARRMTVWSASASASWGTAMNTSADAVVWPAGMVRLTFPVRAV